MQTEDFFREISDGEDSSIRVRPEIGTAQINVFEWDSRLFYLFMKDETAPFPASHAFRCRPGGFFPGRFPSRAGTTRNRRTAGSHGGERHFHTPAGGRAGRSGVPDRLDDLEKRFPPPEGWQPGAGEPP